MNGDFADDAVSRNFYARAEALIRRGRNFVWEVETDRLYWTDEVVRIYGVDPQSFDCKASAVARLIHPDDVWRRERAISEAMQGKKVTPFEYRVTRNDRTQKVVRVEEMHLERSPDGSAFMAGVVRDVTEIRELEEQLGLLNEELELRVRARTAELEQANLRLLELDHLKSMFIATTSHELRTPLNSILGFISMTLQGLSGELNEEQKDNLSRAHGSALHLLSLINDIIDISKLEAGKTEVYPESFALEEMAAEAAGVMEPQIRARGLALETDVPCALLFTDRKRLLQCLLNLLGNAVKFTEKGSILLSGRVRGDTVELSVTDTGIGISQKNLARLFHPFERLDSHLRVKAGGTGLGLYLTKKLCTDILQGTISVQSSEGEGSVFTMRIPRDIGGRNLT